MKQSEKFLRTAVVYVRDYKRESANIYGLAEQEKAIVHYADENGFRILRVFREENISAKSFNRPQFSEMTEYIKSNKWRVKFLIVSDLNRLSTDPAGLRRFEHFLKENGIKLISIVRSMLRHTKKQVKQTL